MQSYQVLSLRMFIQKVDPAAQTQKEVKDAMMGEKPGDDWEMPHNPESVNVIKLFTREDSKLIKNVLKAGKVKEQAFQAELDKVFKNVALQTERAKFSSIELMKTDLLGVGSGLQLHCLTTQDDLTAVVLVN